MERASSMTYHETDESRELELYTTNNGDLYRRPEWRYTITHLKTGKTWRGRA